MRKRGTSPRFDAKSLLFGAISNLWVKTSRWADDGKLTLLKYRSDAKRIYRQLSERERKVERDIEGMRRKRAGSGRRVVRSTVKYCLRILHLPSYARLIPFCPDRLSVCRRALPWRTQGPEVKRGRVHFTLTRCYAVMEDFIGLPLGKGRPDLI